MKPLSEARQAEASSHKYCNGQVGLNRHEKGMNKISHSNKILFQGPLHLCVHEVLETRIIYRRRHSCLYYLSLGLHNASITTILIFYKICSSFDLFWKIKGM